MKDFKIAAVNESARELAQFQKMFQKTSYKSLVFVPFQFVPGCLSSLMEFKPDIVFADCNLGVFTGGVFVEQTSAFLPKADFILTGVASENEIVDAMRAGAVDYLRKDELSPETIGNCLLRVIKKKVAKQELMKTELKFRTIFDKVMDAIIIVDYRTGLILQANEACENLLGYKSYQLQGEPFTKLFPSQPRVSYAKILSEIKVTGSVVESQAFLRSNNTTCPMDVTAAVIPYGEDKAILLNLRDVTARRVSDIEEDQARGHLEKRIRDRTSQVERANRKLKMEIFERKRVEGHLIQSRSRLEAAEKIGKMGHWEYDLKNRRVIFSPELFRLFEKENQYGLTSAESFDDIAGENISNRLMTKIEMVEQNGNTETLEYWTQLESGRRACHYVTIDAIKNSAGKIENILGVIQEITEQKSAAEDLQTALEREREHHQMTNVFVSMVSHELRTPLAVIQSAVDLLKDQETNTEEYSQCLYSIESSLDRMTGIMEKVLFLGRMESRQIRFKVEEVDFEKLANKVRRDLEMAGIAKSRIQMNFDSIPTKLSMDETFMFHAVQNLLSNALKYSSEGHPVQMSARMDQGVLEILISDKGIGIPEDEQSRLFEIFHRCRNASRITGSGVGMVVIKRCVEMHGGTIDFESKEGIGTTFRLRFPRVQMDSSKEEAVSAP